MENGIKDPFSEYPYALEPHIAMNEPNERITIYSGEFLLQNGTKSVCLNGTIQYSWFQHCKIIFEGACAYPLGLVESCDIYIKGHKCAEGHITEQHFDSLGSTTRIRGIISELTFGSIDEPCDKVHFALFNLHKLFGDTIRRGDDGVARDRLTFNCSGYSIVIENRDKLKDLESDIAKTQSGYYISHYCQITKENGQISAKEVNKILDAFSMYISFVFGKRYMPFFVYGYKAGNKVCECHSVERMPNSSGVFYWAPTFKYEEIEQLWNNFYNLWHKDADHRDILTTAIHWYIESNTNSGALEGAYIMAFAGIELMYNVLIGIKGKDSAGKIKALACLLNIDSVITAKDLCDMRNILVHYGQGNRTLYSKMDNCDKYNRMTTATYILELSILKYLGYQGHYVNRISNEKWRGAGEEIVPYCTQESSPNDIE